LSQPLVKAAVEHAIANGKTFTDLKILDNACGSGHFLVEALGYLTDLALAQLDRDAALQQLVTEESAKIAGQLRFLNLDYAPEDAQILKRALLKRCIFGVDLNPFAVELARLSLWMDSFIFGTPLSFIEHHVQHGNPQNPVPGAMGADGAARRQRFADFAEVLRRLSRARARVAGFPARVAHDRRQRPVR